jgi:hypothetical protein
MPKIYLIGIVVFVALGYLTMGEWEHLFIPHTETG